MCDKFGCGLHTGHLFPFINIRQHSYDDILFSRLKLNNILFLMVFFPRLGYSCAGSFGHGEKVGYTRRQAKCKYLVDRLRTFDIDNRSNRGIRHTVVRSEIIVQSIIIKTAFIWTIWPVWADEHYFIQQPVWIMVFSFQF